MCTEMRFILCTWFGEICSCCSLTAQTGPAWVLLNWICKELISSLYNFWLFFDPLLPSARTSVMKAHLELTLASASLAPCGSRLVCYMYGKGGTAAAVSYASSLASWPSHTVLNENVSIRFRDSTSCRGSEFAPPTRHSLL